jgi:hypothetical protein
MITTEWYDDTKNIIIHKHPPVWGIDDFLKARQQSLQFINSVNHRVDLIIFKPGMNIDMGMLYYTKESLSLFPSNTGFVVVDQNRTAWMILKVFQRINKYVKHRVDFAFNIEEALEKIEVMRIRSELS